jgi:anthranilate phosphoribosyltransferase
MENTFQFDKERAYVLGKTLLEANEQEARKILLALQKKGETVADVLGMERAFRETMVPLDEPLAPYLCLDVCGAGADGTNSFNISTATAILLAACGVPVAKNCGPASSRTVGSSDILAALGMPLATKASQINRMLNEYGLAFISARDFFPSLARLRSVGKSIKGPTIINLVAPLLSPANVIYRLLGVSSINHLLTMGEVLCALGIKKALVVMSIERQEDGITLIGAAAAAKVDDDGVTRQNIPLSNFPFNRSFASAIAAGRDAKEGASIITSILSSSEMGHRRNVVIANAAAAWWMMGKEATIKESVKHVRGILDSGKAEALLRKIKRCSLK